MVGPSEAARGPRREDSGRNDRSNSRRGNPAKPVVGSNPAKPVVGSNPGRGTPAKPAGHSNTFRTRPNPSNIMRRNN